MVGLCAERERRRGLLSPWGVCGELGDCGSSDVDGVITQAIAYLSGYGIVDMTLVGTNASQGAYSLTSGVWNVRRLELLIQPTNVTNAHSGNTWPTIDSIYGRKTTRSDTLT